MPAASAQEASAVLRKKAETSSRVASNAGSPKDAIAMIGTKTSTMPTSPAAPVARAKVAHGSGCDMGFSMVQLRRRVAKTGQRRSPSSK